MKKLIFLLLALVPALAPAVAFAQSTGGGNVYVPGGAGSGLPSCSTSQLIYYAATGTTGTCLTLGTNLTISSGVLNASSTAATAFSALTGSTNTTAAMLVGTGASLGPAGTGIVTANALSGSPAVTVSSIIDSGISASTSPICPNGIGGAFTTTGCASGSMVYPGAGIPQSTGSAWGTSIIPGTGVVTALGDNVGTAGSFVVNGGALGAPSSGTLTNATGLPISTGVTGLASGIATFLGTPTSANLAAAVTNETGSGLLVFATSPTLTTPNLGTPSTVVLTNATGTAASLTAGLAEGLTGSPAITVSSCTGCGSSTAFQANGTALSSSSTVNFENGAGIVISNPSAGNVQFSSTASANTFNANHTVAAAEMGGQDAMNVSGGGTLTIPPISSTVFATGMSLSVVNYSASTLAISTTPTINSGGGCISGTGVPSGDSWQLLSNGTTLDCIQTVPSAASAGVSSFTGDGSLLSNSASTGAVTATLANAAADSLWGNTSGSSGAPGYHAVNATALAALLDTTAITVSGCTPSASSLGPTAGTITQPSSPCTTATFTMAVTAPHGWICKLNDETLTNSGTHLPDAAESSSTTTTCTVPILSGFQTAGDKLTLIADWY